ncbi:MAG: peroxidase-related enzyme [Acidimicrobiales bacterium]
MPPPFPISVFPVPTLDELPDDIRDRIKAVAEESGFVPNVFVALAHRPEQFRAFFAYHDELMERDSALTKTEREMIVVATSAANDCHYCVIAHGAILRIRAKNPLVADQVAVNHRRADISERQKAMIDFAVKLALHPGEVGGDDRARLREHGFSDGAIWDIGAVTAFFALSNRMANLLELRPNDEFFGMGRDIKPKEHAS